MISILIPVYNCEVISLVNELSRQLNRLSVEGEIIVFDDCSSSFFLQLNREVITLGNVNYKELDRNYGRITIRRLLAAEARCEWLLFLDCDSRIISQDFLQRYIESIQREFDVYAGGRVYPAKPFECNKQLHWKYGVKKESHKGNTVVLHTNNFCIRKTIFLKIEFPDFFKSYGHEDTLMEIELTRLGKKILHIVNPIEHNRIEDAESILHKTQLALHNLFILANIVDKETLRRHVSLFRMYFNVKKFRLEFVVRFFYRLFRKAIIRNLNSCKPSLLLFDFYKLYHFVDLSGTKNQNKPVSFSQKICL